MAIPELLEATVACLALAQDTQCRFENIDAAISSCGAIGNTDSTSRNNHDRPPQLIPARCRASCCFNGLVCCVMPQTYKPTISKPISFLSRAIAKVTSLSS
ncbi:hypothetical protein [Fischerella sp. PCC 9605]|uniref:hypothetical protein n=1 Tax=Fischerella sp. PCC 9605 TaxID=1173024 RepID=UPI0004B779CA|nr:hypothetical protein [Fischerella sp. PCC 9605]